MLKFKQGSKQPLRMWGEHILLAPVIELHQTTPAHVGRTLPLGIEDEKGGLSEYARMMGQKQSNITVYRNGAMVLESLDKTYMSTYRFLDKAVHLAHIHSTPREL